MRRANTADPALTEVFGLGVDDLETSRIINNNLPNAMFGTFLSVIESSGAVARIEAWHAADNPSPAGRKSSLPTQAIFMALLLNAYWGHGYSYKQLARTICKRITNEQAVRLGYRRDEAHISEWYHRAWRSMHRVLDTIDPWHLSPGLGKKFTGPEFAKARTLYDETREQRAHELSALMVRASIELLPKKYLESYRGDLAIDSTFIPVQGTINPNDYSKKSQRTRKGMPLRDMRNGDPQCGWYTRAGDHDGSEITTSKAGYEATTTTMADEKEGAFPFTLITAMEMHLPGRFGPAARSTVEQHADFTAKRGVIMADRAFNGLAPAQFQEPIRKLRYETAYDYKKTELGPQGSVPGKPIIVLDGVLFVNRMPEIYMMISRLHATEQIDPATGNPYTLATRNEILKARAAYRMKPKGRVDADGHQRFEYPDPRSYMAFDPVTGSSTTDNPTGSVTIGLDAEVIKHLQKYPWMSKDWNRAYGQRNQVESSNALIKTNDEENIGSARARTGRGFAYNYLSMIIAVVATNIRRIITGITRLNTFDNDGKPKQRARKRRDSSGYRLTHITGTRAYDSDSQVMPPDKPME